MNGEPKPMRMPNCLKKKFFYDLRHYFLDDPHLYKEGVDGVIRHCVPEHEKEQILRECHSEAYGGYHAGDRTAHKVLQSSFYWPTLKRCS